MRYIKSIDEQLFYSETIQDVLNYLIYQYKDPVACLIYALGESDIYDTKDDLNYIELADQAKMINFRPLKRRTATSNYQSSGSTPMKIGRVARAIVDKTKMHFNRTIECDGVIYRFSRNEIVLALFGDYTFLVSSWVDPKVKINGELEGDIYFIDQVSKFSNLYPNKTTKICILESDYDAPTRPQDLNSLPIQHFKIEYDSGFNINDKDIERFVDRMSAYIKLTMGNDDSEMLLVQGEEIRWWYSEENYASLGVGELGNSCMADPDCASYFDIYCSIDNVSLLILLNSEKKLIGRALVWKLTSGRFFMDRVYSIIAKDKYVFYSYAQKKNWMYKQIELGEKKVIIDGQGYEVDKIKLEVQLESWNFGEYPYLDTLFYLDTNSGLLTNQRGTSSSGIIKLIDTRGGWLRMAF